MFNKIVSAFKKNDQMIVQKTGLAVGLVVGVGIAALVLSKSVSEIVEEVVDVTEAA